MRTKKRLGRPAEIDPQNLHDAGEQLFAENRFDGTSTREIAKTADCNVAMIGYHFGSKDGLYRAILSRHFTRLRDRVDNTLKLDETPDSELAKQWPDFADADERRFCAMLFMLANVIVVDDYMHKIMSREMMSGAKTLGPLLSKNNMGVAEPLRDHINSLIRKGKLNRQLDWRFVVISLVGPLVYSCIAAPILTAVYQFEKNDKTYARKLSIHLTKTFFNAWRIS
jgi:AcrR family transcriptional regulator